MVLEREHGSELIHSRSKWRDTTALIKDQSGKTPAGLTEKIFSEHISTVIKIAFEQHLQ